jgi:hypothetical protein
MKSKTRISLSNWSTQEENFAEKRESQLNRISSDEVAHAPFVFAERQSITTALTRIDLFRKILEVQGSVVECGVHKGN